MSSLEVKEGGGTNPSRAKSYFRWHTGLLDRLKKAISPEEKKKIRETLRDLDNLE